MPLSSLGAVVKNPPSSAGDSRDVDSIPGSGRFHGGENGNPLQHSCLGNSMGRGVWWATIHAVAKSWTRLSTQVHDDFKIHCKSLIGKKYLEIKSRRIKYDMYLITS